MEKLYQNIGYFFLLLIPLTIIGFHTTYIFPSPEFAPSINIYVHLHAFFASIWLLMLIAQPFLIKNGKYPLHRTIGKLSYVVFPLLILSIIPQIISIIERGDLKSLFFPAADVTVLILFYALAIFHRKDRTKHMRYMIGTAIVFLGPTFGRIGFFAFGWSPILTQNVQYAIIYAILLSLVFYDRKHQKNYQPYLVIMGAYAFHLIAFHLIF